MPINLFSLCLPLFDKLNLHISIPKGASLTLILKKHVIFEPARFLNHDVFKFSSFSVSEDFFI